MVILRVRLGIRDIGISLINLKIENNFALINLICYYICTFERI